MHQKYRNFWNIYFISRFWADKDDMFHNIPLNYDFQDLHYFGRFPMEIVEI